MTKTLRAADVGNACVCLNLQRAARAVARRYDQALKPSGLTSGQFSVLAALLRDDAIALGDLAQVLGLDRTTLNRNLRPLEDAGLVETRPGKIDQRVRALRLSAKGRARVEQAIPLWRAAQGRSDGLMGKAAWPGFKRVLDSLA